MLQPPVGVFAAIVLAVVVLAAGASSSPPLYELWTDYPGSAAYKSRNPMWYDLIDVVPTPSFVSTAGVVVQVCCLLRGTWEMAGRSTLGFI